MDSRSNDKRVLRLMRDDNLLCVRKRAFVITTDSRHNLPVYPNLARQIQTTATNQLWIADITYIRLRTEFIYLAVVLDSFSRRVIGWALGRTLEAGLAVTALRMALIERQPMAGLVHHSDRGVQYASQEERTMPKQRPKKPAHSRKKTAARMPDILDVRGIAALLTVLTDTVYDLLASGQLPSQ